MILRIFDNEFSVFSVSKYYSTCYSCTLYCRNKHVCVIKHALCVMPITATSLFLSNPA